MRKLQNKELRISKNRKLIIAALRRDKVGVLLTDTIYGVVGRALSRKAVARLYEVKGRDSKKPFIILISSYADLKKFGVKLTAAEKKFLATNWPGPLSAILPVPSRKFAYLHRGTKSLAFRMPRPAHLRALVRQTGPLAAPSANPEGEPPARNIREAKNYFGGKVDFYLDGGARRGRPSKLVRLTGGKIEILRK